jgi:VWFA-related protein
MEVEVRVRDSKGRRVPDLERDDFRLFENGEPQQIATLEYISGPEREAAIRLPARRDKSGAVQTEDTPEVTLPGRATRILIATHIAPGEVARVRKAIRKFIADDLPAGVLVSIDGTPFIADKKLLLDVVDGKTSSGQIPGKALRPDVQAGTDFADQSDRDIVRQGFGSSDEAFSNLILDQHGRARMYRYADMIRDLADYPGKKVIVLFARGLQMGFSSQQDLAPTPSLPGQKGVFVNLENAGLVRYLRSEAMRARIHFYVVASQALEALDAQGSVTFTTQNIEQLFGSATPSGDELAAARYGVSTRATTAGLGEGSYLGRQGLRMLAEQTGGRAVLNSNDMGQVFEILNEDLGGYYLLGYYPPDRKPGAFREIKVETGRRGLKLEHSRGFYDQGELETFTESQQGGLSLRVEGKVASLTTQAAPKKALKAYQQAFEALGGTDPDYETAFTELARATEAFPEFATAWNLIGYLRFARGETTEARTAFQKAIEADETYAGPRLHLLRLAAREQSWPDVEITAQGLLALESRNPEAAYYLAVARFNQNNVDAAQQAIQQAVTAGKEADYPQIYRLQGDLSAAQGNFLAAANAYREFLTTEPDSPLAGVMRDQISEWETQTELLTLGEHLQAGRWDVLDRESEDLLNSKPDLSSARLFRALAKFNLGDLDAADRLAQSVRDAPDAEQFPQVYYLLGLVHSEQGDIKTAIDEWRSFLQARDDSPLAAEVRETIKDWESLLEP